METRAQIATASGSKYLQQLCQHWSHKFEVEFDAAAGRIPFPTATLDLAAAPETLTLTIAAPDAVTLDRMEAVVVDHLKRFSFREELAIAWERA